MNITDLYVSKELLSAIFAPLCAAHQLSLTELLILLHLKQHDGVGTASNIVESLKLAKSHVSASVHTLEIRGFVTGSHAGENRRTIRLQLCDSAVPIAAEAEIAQARFLSVLQQDFSPEEAEQMRQFIGRMTANANLYLKSPH